MSYLIDRALALLQDDPRLFQDAKAGARVGNTLAGSILALTTRSPRWATEEAVAAAVTIIDRETRRDARRKARQ